MWVYLHHPSFVGVNLALEEMMAALPTWIR